ncbi:MAG: methyltransferase domain-containing protein [Planctomycetes bacterium]|nr:methyltransferase domain-containing protein [Planctomycetota bacterium]
MTDRPRGQARQPHPNPSKRPSARPNSAQRPGKKPRPVGSSGRRKPHARTAHDLDPRKAAFETLRRLTPGELLEPAVQATLRYQGWGIEHTHRVMPMLEDATRFTLLFDHLIAHLSSRPTSELDPDVRAALHLFLSWYLLDDPRATYAYGNAAVEMLSDKHKGRGFVNALVRRLGDFVKVEQGEPEDYRAEIKEHRPIELWADKARLGNGRMLVAERPIFPDPATKLAEHLSIVASLPPYFVEQLIEQHGPEAATQIAIACVERPATWVRVNPMVAGANELAEWWTRNGVSVQQVLRNDGGRTVALPPHTRNLTTHPSWELGGFYIQDYSAQLVAPAMQPQAGEALLDLCSAPGGKAGHLGELTKDQARILACDLTEPKIELIQQNIARMGYRSIATVQADATEVRFPEQFDGVLIDAPCSNSGVLARRVEARHRITKESVSELQALQLRILENAAANLKRGGRIVYSVCSILLDEGPDVVHRFLRGKIGDVRREDVGWEVEHESYLLPIPAYHDGGYVTRIRAPK